MKLGNFAFELADLRAEQERQAGIDRASKAVREVGAIDCVRCGDPIDKERRQAMPSARRCIDCQLGVERDQWRHA